MRKGFSFALVFPDVTKRFGDNNYVKVFMYLQQIGYPVVKKIKTYRHLCATVILVYTSFPASCMGHSVQSG